MANKKKHIKCYKCRKKSSLKRRLKIFRKISKVILKLLKPVFNISININLDKAS